MKGVIQTDFKESSDEINSLNSVENGEISIKELILKIRDWFRYIGSKWIVIVIAGILGGVLGLMYSFSKIPVYTAQLTFVLEEEQQSGGLGGYAGLAGQFGIDLGGGGGGVFTGENLLSLMRSRTMIEKALLTTVTTGNKTETLAEAYIRINKLRDEWTKSESKFATVKFLPGVLPADFTADHNTLITSFYNSILAQNLTIDKFDKKSSIISVQVTSPDELFAKHFSEAVTKEVSNFYIEVKTKRSSENLAILQHQTDSVKRVFNSAITGVATSADANPNPNLARQVLKVPSQRKQFDVQINQAMLSQLVQNLEMAKISLRKETPLILVIDKPILPLKVARVDTKKMVIVGIIISSMLAIFIVVFYKAIPSYLKS